LETTSITANNFSALKISGASVCSGQSGDFIKRDGDWSTVIINCELELTSAYVPQYAARNATLKGHINI
jgi:hypothetical protein